MVEVLAPLTSQHRKLGPRALISLQPQPLQILDPGNIGALIIRIGFGAPSYYNYKKEPEK